MKVCSYRSHAFREGSWYSGEPKGKGAEMISHFHEVKPEIFVITLMDRDMKVGVLQVYNNECLIWLASALEVQSHKMLDANIEGEKVMEKMKRNRCITLFCVSHIPRSHNSNHCQSRHLNIDADGPCNQPPCI